MSALTAKALNLMACAERYGDAKAASEKVLRAWQFGDPVPKNTTREPEMDLLSAARAYATSTRKGRSQPSNTQDLPAEGREGAGR